MNKTIDRGIETEDYRFSEKDHVHQILIGGEWKNLTGVSEVVKDITNFGMASYYGSRRAIMELGYDPKRPWAKNASKEDMEVDSVKRLDELTKTHQTLKSIELEALGELLDRAYKAPSSYAKKRADKGTSSHEVVSEWINLCIKTNGGKPVENSNPIIQKFINLTEHLEPVFVSTEKHGHNRELFIGGITDVIVDTNIGTGIWDMKDRPSIYEKDILQMGGYLNLFPIDFTHVMGIPLEGEEVKMFYDVESLKTAFQNQLSVYRFLKAIK